jgi:hypothetical protein
MKFSTGTIHSKKILRRFRKSHVRLFYDRHVYDTYGDSLILISPHYINFVMFVGRGFELIINKLTSLYIGAI